ncbi:MAG: Holliday junction branch migration protein RuvA [Thermodesulfobacteriota bacterium]
MIASLRGVLLLKNQETLVVEVGGVGYEVFFPQAGHDRLPPAGGELMLHIQTVVREDAFLLFGFLSPEEKEMFQLLNTVSGIGPKVAMNMLSGMAPDVLSQAILHDDLARLTRLPGVGKKTAERLCLELKDKVRFVPAAMAAATHHPAAQPEEQRLADAISALVNLGYPVARAREAMESVRQRAGDEEFAAMRIEELLRHALRALA